MPASRCALARAYVCDCTTNAKEMHRDFQEQSPCATGPASQRCNQSIPARSKEGLPLDQTHLLSRLLALAWVASIPRVWQAGEAPAG